MSSDGGVTRVQRWRNFVRWLSAPAGLALLSVVSAVVGAAVQDLRSERDLHRTWLQESSKHQMVARKTYLDEQTAAVEQLYQAISRLRQASTNLIDITMPEFDDENFDTGTPATTIEDQKHQVRDEFNHALDHWQQAKPLADFRLTQFRGSAVNLQRSWSAVKAAATLLSTCAKTNYLKAFREDVKFTDKPCTSEENELDKRLGVLSTELRQSREAAWHDWEHPQLWR